MKIGKVKFLLGFVVVVMLGVAVFMYGCGSATTSTTDNVTFNGAGS